MKAIVTGAGGFVGRRLVERLLAEGYKSLTLFDQRFDPDWLSNDKRVTRIEGELQDPALRRELVGQPFNSLFHLAAVPGGAAENDPALSRKVNLDATLDLFEEAVKAADKPRIVYTSTIAVLGAPMPDPVTDDSPLVPNMTYGAHKAMVEFALADLHRRGLVDAVSVRLPGIVARPPAPSGLKSAFLSNIFHALKSGDAFVTPVSPTATFWLMSVAQCAANLAHGARLDSGLMPRNRAVTLPALRCTMAGLASTISKATGTSIDQVSYEPDPALDRDFGSQPELISTAAEKAGFARDSSLPDLVSRVLQDL